MTPENVNMCMQAIQSYLPDDKTLYVRNLLSKATDECRDVVMSASMKNTTTTLLLSIFLGGLGVDRFYIGDTGLGVAKLLLGWITCGIWPLIDIFMCYKKAKDNNLNTILSVIQ